MTDLVSQQQAGCPAFPPHDPVVDHDDQTAFLIYVRARKHERRSGPAQSVQLFEGVDDAKREIAVVFVVVFDWRQDQVVLEKRALSLGAC